MKFKFLWIGLFVIFSSVGSYATSEDRLGFALNSVKLLKKTWYGGDANLKVLILYENDEGTASKVEVVDNKNAPLNKTISLQYNLGAYIPINGDGVDINLVFLNENDNIELAGLVLSAMKNIAKRETIKNIKKLSNWNWMSAVAKEVVVEFAADYTEKKIIAYLKENEIERVNLKIRKWNDEQTITRGNVKLSYETRLAKGTTPKMTATETIERLFKNSGYWGFIHDITVDSLAEFKKTVNESDEISLLFPNKDDCITAGGKYDLGICQATYKDMEEVCKNLNGRRIKRNDKDIGDGIFSAMMEGLVVCHKNEF